MNIRIHEKNHVNSTDPPFFLVNSHFFIGWGHADSGDRDWKLWRNPKLLTNQQTLLQQNQTKTWNFYTINSVLLIFLVRKAVDGFSRRPRCPLGTAFLKLPEGGAERGRLVNFRWDGSRWGLDGFGKSMDWSNKNGVQWEIYRNIYIWKYTWKYMGIKIFRTLWKLIFNDITWTNIIWYDITSTLW